MKTSLFAISAAAVLSSLAFAQDADALRGKMKDLEERVRTAKEQGRGDEAHELMQQMQRIRAEIGEREQKHGQDKGEMLKNKIHDLRQAGKNEEADQLERRLRNDGGHQNRPVNLDGDRKHHAMEAIKHLRAAGLNAPAERIEQMLREHGKDAAHSKGGEGAKSHSHNGEGAKSRESGEPEQRAIRDLQEHTHKALREMHEQHQRALRETHEQMSKMARAIEELREQKGKGEHRKE